MDLLKIKIIAITPSGGSMIEVHLTNQSIFSLLRVVSPLIRIEFVYNSQKHDNSR